MLNVGLTGGIGSGKSEVAQRLARLGAVIVDSDAIAHEVVEPGTVGLQRLVEEFGREILDVEGRLDRESLGRRVFADDDALRRLNAIVHPLVGKRVLAEIAAAGERDPSAIVVNDVPLLAEGGFADSYDAVVVVDAPVDVQVGRLVERRGMAEDDARARIAVQATREQRLAIADHVIDNSGSLDDLQPQIESVWRSLQAAAATGA